MNTVITKAPKLWFGKTVLSSSKSLILVFKVGPRIACALGKASFQCLELDLLD